MEKQSLLQTMHQQTAKIAWSELQRFFAQGRVFLVNDPLELPKVAVSVARDDSFQISEWKEQKLLNLVTDQQAKQWSTNEVVLWAVVVAPFVFVQEINEEDNESNN